MSEDNKNNQRPALNQGSPYYYYPPASPAYYPGYPYRQFPLPQQAQATQQPKQYQPYQQQTQQPQQYQPYQQQAGYGQSIPGMLPMQQSYIENILRLNRGKEVTVYMTFEDRDQMTFKGRIEAAGRDHIILSDPDTGRRYLLLMVYLDYVVFSEEIDYEYPFGSQASNQLSNFPPR